MGSEGEYPTVPLGSILDRIDAGRSPDLSDVPATAGEWGVLKVSAVTVSGFRGVENKAIGDASLIDERIEVHPGDLLISRANTPELVGATCIVTPSRSRLMLSDKTLRLVVNYARVDPKYLCLCLSSRRVRRQIEVAASGSSRSTQNISQESIEALAVPCPLLVEQRRIVEYLDALTDAERLIEKSIAKQRSVRRGLLLGSMAPAMQGSVLNGWERAPLGDVVPYADYGISDPLVTDPSGVPTLRMNNLQNGRIDLSDLPYCPTVIPDRLFLEQGDVLFNRTNSIDHIGKAALWQEDRDDVTFASYLVRVNPDPRRLLPGYLVEWFGHPLVRQRIKAISTVAVQQVNVNPTRLRAMDICFPAALEDQRKLVENLLACDERIRSAEDELDKLRRLKKGLSDDLLNAHRAAT